MTKTEKRERENLCAALKCGAARCEIELCYFLNNRQAMCVFSE